MDSRHLLDLVVSLLLLGGLFILLTGSFGLLRLRDVYSRMHATTKSTTLGVAGIVFAALIFLRGLDMSSGLREVLIVVFLFLTAPVGAHMIARAAYRAGVSLWDGGAVDEFKTWEEKNR